MKKNCSKNSKIIRVQRSSRHSFLFKPRKRKTEIVTKLICYVSQRKKKREVRCLDFDRVQLLLAVFSRPSLGVKRSRKLPSRGGGQPVLVRFSTRWTMAVRASTKVKYEGWDKGLCIDRRGRTREGGRALLAEERTKRKNERGGRRK